MNDLLANTLSFDPYEYLDAVKTLLIAPALVLLLLITNILNVFILYKNFN